MDPSNVSGNISVLLDVQYNDETVTNVDLTLGEEVISCRGASSDDAAPTGVMPTLAESGGSVEIECFFDTDQVAGECTGMQMEPRFANGEHELGARITTADGTTRDALATQMITLKNSNYVMIDHNPGSVSHIVGGVTFYGGPTTDDNVNTFDVCPVAFDGTMVGTIGLRGMTDTMQEEGDSYNDDLSFRTHRSGRYGEYNGVRRMDDEPPFTFTVLSSQNALTEDRNAEGHGGHWIIQDGTISDPDGLDISSKFVPGDMENNLTKIGPIYFDFASPRYSGDSEVVIEGASVANVHYSGKRGTYDGRSQRFWVSNVTERGAGGVSDVISVGDCSIGDNTDTGRDGAGTAFQAIVEDAAAVGDLPEDDPDAGNLSDDGGVQCYTAELQSLMDRMGNSRNLSRVRIQSAEFFGVDKTSPDVDDLVPDEELVLMDGAMLSFEVEDPELETGEDGSGFNAAATRAFWGTSWSNRYFRTGYGDADDPGDVITVDDGVVMIETVTGNAAADRERRHVVNVEVRDSAVPPNLAGASFAYSRDAKGPGITLSKSQSDIGSINTATVTVSVGGTISDANVIKTAELSIREKMGTATCMASADLEAGSGKPVVRNKRDLENNTNKIEFDESFTLRQAEGTKTYCFWLASADIAVGSDGRGDGNMGNYELGSFSVAWPAGPPPTPPGPTFEFMNVDGTAIDGALAVTEGNADGTMYAVMLANTDADTVAVTLTAPAGFTVAPATLNFPNADGTSDTLLVTVTTAHDLDIVSETGAVTHSATGFDDATVMAKSMDEDFEIMVSPSSISEDDSPTEVTVTVNAGAGADVANAIDVTLAAGANTVAADIAIGSAATAAVTVDATTRTGMAKVMVDAADDAVRDEDNESIALTVSVSTQQGVYTKPANIMIMDDDPDVMLSLSQSEVDEDAGTVTVTITATADAPVNGITTFTLARSGTATSGTDYTDPGTVTLTIDARGTTATVDVTLTITDDADDESNETIIFDDADGATVGAKTYTVGPATLTIIDNDDT
ncbi:MAG: hypothetical protein F4143_01850 [Gemmatimonadales bacterium]|nr:hypothetical protein [Gemmatimonadales bacterium]